MPPVKVQCAIGRSGQAVRLLELGESRAAFLIAGAIAAGRQENRRVELVVSGDAIGSPSTTTTGSLR